MKFKRLNIGIVFLICVRLTSLQAQETTTTAGGQATGAGGNESYTIDQIVYSTYSAETNGSVSEGVQHPFDISVVTGVAETEISLNIFVYPNPTTNFLVLKIADYDKANMTYQLCDMNGKLLESEKIMGNQINIFYL